jgi:hypothetical protein
MMLSDSYRTRSNSAIYEQAHVEDSSRVQLEPVER